MLETTPKKSHHHDYLKDKLNKDENRYVLWWMGNFNRASPLHENYRQLSNVRVGENSLPWEEHTIAYPVPNGQP